MASNEYQLYYAVIRTIPPGKVMTYGDVAANAGRPREARRVGYALSALHGDDVPWWRVINAKGELSPRSRDGRPSDEQRDRLAAEGVDFDLEGKLDLGRYRHRPHWTDDGAMPWTDGD